jgi:hypothetical protein
MSVTNALVLKCLENQSVGHTVVDSLSRTFNYPSGNLLTQKPGEQADRKRGQSCQNCKETTISKAEGQQVERFPQTVSVNQKTCCTNLYGAYR